MNAGTQDPNQGIMRLTLTRPALERLIGDDTQIEVELRQQIVNFFIEKHLAPMLNSKESKEIVAKLETYAREQIQAHIGVVKTNYGGTISFDLAPVFKKLFDEQVKKQVDAAVQSIFPTDKIRQEIESRMDYWKEYAERKVKQVLDANIEAMVKKGVEDRIEAAAKSLAG